MKEWGDTVVQDQSQTSTEVLGSLLSFTLGDWGDDVGGREIEVKVQGDGTSERHILLEE